MNIQALYNTLATAVLSGINFLTIPIFTRILGPANYGRFDVFHSWILIITCFIDLCCRMGLSTAKYKFGEEQYYRYRSSTLLLGACSAAVIFTCGCLLRSPLASYLRYSPMLVMVMILTAYAYSVVEFAKLGWIYEKKARNNFLMSVSLSLLTVLLSLLLLKSGRFDQDDLYLGRVIGFCAPYILFAIVLWVTLFHKGHTGYNKEYWSYALLLGVPIIFHTLSQSVLAQSDRVMMRQFNVGDVSVGIYGLFHTFAGITSVLLNALNVSWCPFYYDDLHENRFDLLKTKCGNYMGLFTGIMCGFLLVSREVSWLFGDASFQTGIGVLPIMALSVYFTFMYQFPVNFEFFHKQTKIIAAGTIGAGLLNILLNALMIPVWGMYGAAIATCISYGMLFVAHYIIVTYVMKESFHIKFYTFLPFLAGVLSAIAVFYMLADFWLVRWLLASAVGVWLLANIIKRKSIF